MCHKGMCLTCIPVEKGCFVFAIIGAVISLLTLLSSVIIALLILTGAMSSCSCSYSPGTSSSYGGYGAPTYTTSATCEISSYRVGNLHVGVFVLIMGTLCLVASIFSVLLCYGIHKRNPGHVKTYFIYGVVITVIAVLGALITLFCGGELGGALILFGCVFYSLFLLLVHKTYNKLLEDEVLPSPGRVRLTETETQTN